MTDKRATMPPRILQLLLVVLCPSAADGERINAMRAVDRYLASVGSNGHELMDRIKTPPVSDEDMQRVFDAGYAKRLADEAEQRRRAVAVTASLASGAVGEGVNGYTWREIAGHCAANGQHLNAWEREFTESVAEQLASRFSRPSEPILRRIFLNRFGGRIE